MQYAAWLRRQGSVRQDQLIAVHVVEDDAVGNVVQYHPESEVIGAAADACKRMIDDSFQRDVFDQPLVVRARRAEEQLSAAVDLHEADALLIGRQARTGGFRLVRLGRVARRLARQLPGPVFVVPPELLASEVGKGPVVLATDLGEERAAAAFARRFAHMVGRAVHVVHVVPRPVDEAMSVYLPEVDWGALVSDRTKQASARLSMWCGERHLTDAPRDVVDGPVGPTLQARAEELDACMVVVGSRMLGPVDRLFTASVGLELAAYSGRAVALVPPELEAGEAAAETAEQRA